MQVIADVGQVSNLVTVTVTNKNPRIQILTNRVCQGTSRSRPNYSITDHAVDG